MMIALLDRAQMQRVFIGCRHRITEAVDIERIRALEIGNAEFDVRDAHDVEGRIEHWFRNWHVRFPQTPRREIL